jgi:transcriptional regulator with XRE-family HTH domain
MESSETPVSPLKAAREARGERLADVAGRAGMSISYLSMIENGLRCPISRQAALAAALERPATELFA